ncbi:hypothetical protein A2U01_0100361, partial [Trifolium medium]|nr:hypothetical protein [Trifolium medium]
AKQGEVELRRVEVKEFLLKFWCSRTCAPHRGTGALRHCENKQ